MSTLFISPEAFAKNVTDANLIGSGSFGCVFSAKYNQKQDVIVKFSKEAKNRDDFVHEALMLALLNGNPQFPQLVAFLELSPKDIPAIYTKAKCLVVEQNNEEPFGVMVQQVAGTMTLADWIMSKKTKPIDVEDVRSIVFQVLWAIASVSIKYGVCLADVKPQNIMITETDRKQEQTFVAQRSTDGSFDVFRTSTKLIVKMIDLGGAYVQMKKKNKAATGWMVQYSSTVFTKEYAAPEVLKKQEGIGEGDLYAAGLVLLILLKHNDGAFKFVKDPPSVTDMTDRKLQLFIKNRAGITGLSLLKALLQPAPKDRMGIEQYGANNYVMHSFFAQYYQGKVENVGADNLIMHAKPRWLTEKANILSAREISLQQAFEARDGTFILSSDLKIDYGNPVKFMDDLIRQMRFHFPQTSLDLRIESSVLTDVSLPILHRFAMFYNSLPADQKQQVRQRCLESKDNARPAWWTKKGHVRQWIEAAVIPIGSNSPVFTPLENDQLQDVVPVDAMEECIAVLADKNGRKGFLLSAYDYFTEMCVVLEQMHHVFEVVGGKVNIADGGQLANTAQQVRDNVENLRLSSIKSEVHKYPTLFRIYLAQFAYDQTLNDLTMKLQIVKDMIDSGDNSTRVAEQLEQIEQAIKTYNH